MVRVATTASGASAPNPPIDLLAEMRAGGGGKTSGGRAKVAPRPRHWSPPPLPQCDDCGERDHLWVYRRPTDGRYGEYCERCTDRYTEEITHQSEQLEMGFT